MAAIGPVSVPTRWNGRGALFLFLASVFALYAVGEVVVIAMHYGAKWPDLVHAVAAHRPLRFAAPSPAELFVSVLARSVASISVVLCFSGWLADRVRPSAFGFFRPRFGHLLLAVPIGIVLIVVESLIVRFQAMFVGNHIGFFYWIIASHHGTAAHVLDVLQAALLAPVAEELQFRGLIFTALAQRAPVWVATVVSALLFSALHFDPYSFVPIFAVGVVLALLFYRTKNLWVTITAHGTINFVLLSLYFLKHP